MWATVLRVCGAQLAAPNLQRVVLDTARLLVNLPELLLHLGDGAPFGVKHNADGIGGALIRGKQVAP
jgi:hypothetical protein